MNKVIIHQNEMPDGSIGVTVLFPTQECLQEHTIEEIAEKDVPKGKPYKIIDASDIPADHTFRNAWEVDEADLTDGIGGEYDMFITDPHHPDYVAPIDPKTVEDEVSE